MAPLCFFFLYSSYGLIIMFFILKFIMFRMMTSYCIPFFLHFSNRRLRRCGCILLNHAQIFLILLKPTRVVQRNIKLLKVIEHFRRSLHLEWFIVMHRLLFVVGSISSQHFRGDSCNTNITINTTFFLSIGETIAKEGETFSRTYFPSLLLSSSSVVAAYLHDWADIS